MILSHLQDEDDEEYNPDEPVHFVPYHEDDVEEGRYAQKTSKLCAGMSTEI